MVLFALPEIRLLEDEGHPQRTFPEIDRTLAGRADERDVVDTLHLHVRERGRVVAHDISGEKTQGGLRYIEPPSRPLSTISPCPP